MDLATSQATLLDERVVSLSLGLAAQAAVLRPLERLSEAWQTLLVELLSGADEDKPLNLLTNQREVLGGFGSSLQEGLDAKTSCDAWTGSSLLKLLKSRAMSFTSSTCLLLNVDWEDNGSRRV